MKLLLNIGERELYEEYRDSLSEQSAVAISIRGVPHEDNIRIRNGIQELLSAEVIRLAHEDLRARGVAEEVLDESKLRSSLEGLPLSEEDCRILGAKIRRMATLMMMPRNGSNDGAERGQGPKGGNTPPSQPSTGSVQQATHQTDLACFCVTNYVPGTQQPLTSVPNPFPAPAQAVLYLHVDGLFRKEFSGDTLRLWVEPGAPFGIGPHDMMVGLASEVDWAKEIYAWSFCKGRLSSVYQSSRNGAADYMVLKDECNGADTIVFAKPGFIGLWTDIAHFEPALFWPVFGGKKLTFIWLTDRPNS